MTGGFLGTMVEPEFCGGGRMDESAVHVYAGQWGLDVRERRMGIGEKMIVTVGQTEGKMSGTRATPATSRVDRDGEDGGLTENERNECGEGNEVGWGRLGEKNEVPGAELEWIVGGAISVSEDMAVGGLVEDGRSLSWNVKGKTEWREGVVESWMQEGGRDESGEESGWRDGSCGKRSMEDNRSEGCIELRPWGKGKVETWAILRIADRAMWGWKRGEGMRE
ncbi:hypothetical protein Tco_0715711 [Tanacetum coccineum]